MNPVVEFRKFGKRVEWNDRFQNILELAEGNGIAIDSECQQGYCGTCRVKLLSGEVRETIDSLDDEDEGMILPCVAVPKSDLIIEA